ncbi:MULTISPECIES: GNAT family N-acetyltransferase [Paenibacillus]|uniref:GNAT family N-acetyltransferase n=1 Tax=Paenibacillus TaxID=44249 RepID=UPI00041F5D37|nr:MULTISPECIES: GNAT family N-acetyltransferase [Paenibacillus]
MFIRELEERDDAAIASIIRQCLIEFGGNREGLAWADKSLDNLSGYYDAPGRKYWVIENEGTIEGGCGIAPFADSNEVCELQKMYLLPGARGSGMAAKLMEAALDFASVHYERCYLETLTSMKAAARFYEKHGFTGLEAPLEGSEHYACDAWYIKELQPLKS